MIVQAADWALNKADPPRLLATYLDCLYFKTLPKGGGVDDQPAGLLDKMRYLHDVAQAIYFYEKDGTQPAQQVAWIKKHPGWWKLVKQVRELRKMDSDG